MDSHNAEQFAFENPIDAVGHAQLRHVMTLDHELSDGAYRTFAIYLKYAHQNPACWPSIERIAKDRSKAVVTISRHNKELEDLGYIQRKRRTGLTTLTVIRDLNQVPRLKAIAAQELESRIPKDIKNDRTNISKTTGKTYQKCYVEEEPLEEESKKKTTTPQAAKAETPDNDLPIPEEAIPWKGPPPPAARMFQACANRWPRRATYRRIHETVGEKPADLEFWGQVVSKYIGLNWNPGNVVGMLEWFEKGELPRVQRKNGGGTATRHERNAAIIERARAKCRATPEQALEAEYTIL